MLPVPTLLGASFVHVTKDTLEMELHVKVRMLQFKQSHQWLMLTTLFYR